MTLDLYAYYKKYYQRWYRDQFNDDFFEMKEISHEIAYVAFKNKLRNNEEEITKINILIKKLGDIEKNFVGMRMFYKEISNAVKKNDFEVNVPYPKAHKWNFQSDASAYVYVAVANSRGGECKLGVTTLDPETRANKYSHKYGYSIKIYKSLLVKNPYSIEASAERELAHLRVSKNVEDDSVEWYRMRPQEMYQFILSKIKK